MFKKLFTKIGNAFKPKVWIRDPNVPRATGRSIKEITDNDPYDGELEISIIKDKKTKLYTDISEERTTESVVNDISLRVGKNHIHTHNNPKYPLPSVIDLIRDIDSTINKKISRKQIKRVSVVICKDPKTKEDCGVTYYKIRGFKDKDGNLSKDYSFAYSKMRELSTHSTLLESNIFKYKRYKHFLDIRFIFKPAKGYRFNKETMAFEKIK